MEKKKKKLSLSEKAYNKLKKDIVFLNLRPGEILIEEEISKKLGISRTPIRAALQKLSFEGFVEITNTNRTTVSRLSVRKFENLSYVREALEVLAAKLSSLNRSASDLKTLNSLVKQQQEIISKETLDEKAWLNSDRKFHITIVKSTSNGELEKYLNQINESYNRYLHFTKFEERAEKVTKEHELLYNAIKSKDVDSSIEIMKEHLSGVKESIMSNLIKFNYH